MGIIGLYPLLGFALRSVLHATTFLLLIAVLTRGQDVERLESHAVIFEKIAKNLTRVTGELNNPSTIMCVIML